MLPPASNQHQTSRFPSLFLSALIDPGIWGEPCFEFKLQITKKLRAPAIPTLLEIGSSVHLSWADFRRGCERGLRIGRTKSTGTTLISATAVGDRRPMGSSVKIRHAQGGETFS
jgi:hypothetical protein